MTTSQQPGGSAHPSSVGAGFEDLVKQSAKIADETRDLGTRAVAVAGTAARELRRQGGKKAEQFMDRFDDAVSEHPRKSVLIAVGLGALLGLVLARR